MTNFKKIMIPIDFTSMDKKILQYGSFIAKLLKAEKIYFVHVSPFVMYPLYFEPYFFDNLDRIKEEAVKRLKKVVRKDFTSTNIKIEFKALEGSTVPELLYYSRQQKIDLIIMGRKKSSGLTSERVVRNANCSVLLVTEHTAPKIKNVILPVDFSRHSVLSLKFAEELSGLIKNLQIYAHNIFYRPTYPFAVGYPERFYSPKLKNEIKREMDLFIKKNYHKRNLEKILSFDEVDNLIKEMLKITKEKKGDLIIIGSRGKTKAASMILGSTAEQLIKKDSKTPILIIKKKNENLGLMKLLFS